MSVSKTLNACSIFLLCLFAAGYSHVLCNVSIAVLKPRIERLNSTQLDALYRAFKALLCARLSCCNVT